MNFKVKRNGIFLYGKNVYNQTNHLLKYEVDQMLSFVDHWVSLIKKPKIICSFRRTQEASCHKSYAYKSQYIMHITNTKKKDLQWKLQCDEKWGNYTIISY